MASQVSFGMVYGCLTLFLGLLNLIAWANVANPGNVVSPPSSGPQPQNKLNTALDITSIVAYFFMAILAGFYLFVYPMRPVKRGVAMLAPDPVRRKQVAFQAIIATFLIGFVCLNLASDLNTGAPTIDDGMSMLIQGVLGAFLVGSVLLFAQRSNSRSAPPMARMA
jgi:hypothetical protein